MNEVHVHFVSEEPQDEDHTRLFQLTQRTLNLIAGLVIERFPHLLLKQRITARKGQLLSKVLTEDELGSENSQKRYLICFVDAKGKSYQRGKYCVAFTRNGSNDLLPDEVLQSVIAHELCHAFGCFHSHIGIMSGVDVDNPRESPDLSLDEDSLEILTCGPVCTPCCNAKIDFKYKVSDGCLLIKCTEPICLTVFSREGMYDGVLQKLEKPATDLEMEPRFSDRVTCFSLSGNIFTFDL